MAPNPYSDPIKRNRLFCLADDLAATLLEGVKDKHDIPLITHARSVCNRCSHLSDTQRIAALLHDCLEDGKNPFQSTASPLTIIEALFGDVVSSLVIDLTRGYHTAGSLYKPVTYDEHIKIIVRDYPLAAPIKLADLEDNLDESRGPIPGDLKVRYEKARDYIKRELGL